MHLTSHPAPAAHAACGGASCRAVHRSSRKLCVVHSTDPQRDEGQQPSTSGAWRTRLVQHHRVCIGLPTYGLTRVHWPVNTHGVCQPTTNTTGAAPQIDLLNPAAAIVAGGRQPSTRRAAVGLTVATAVGACGQWRGRCLASIEWSMNAHKEPSHQAPSPGCWLCLCRALPARRVCALRARHALPLATHAPTCHHTQRWAATSAA
jgi:hypothetical protein